MYVCKLTELFAEMCTIRIFLLEDVTVTDGKKSTKRITAPNDRLLDV